MSSEAGSVKRGKRGDGSIRRTKHGTYEYRISYYDEYGQRRSKSFTCKTIDECVDRAEEFKKEVSMRMKFIRPNATISEILRNKAKIDYEKNHTGEQGYDRTLSTIEILERGGIGNMKIADVRPRQIEQYLSSITYYSNAVIGKIYGLLRAAFRMAYDARIIEYNYMLMPELRCPKSDKPDKKMRALTDEEQKKLLKALEKMRSNPEGLVFCDHIKGSIIETTQVNSFFRRITEKAGIPVTGQHALRHSFATRCIEAGVPAVVLKKWLGHTDIHITLDTYADVFARMDFSAADKFDELMESMELGWKTEP
ncbi:MAG: site-specific integrase [Bacillota bacterium]|nr:site-specific integrase [Bacillota bacterium]